MSRTRRTRTLQIIAYIFSAIVALSMILSLIDPALLRSTQSGTPDQRPTATWPPTRTPAPTSTSLPLVTPMLVEPPPQPTVSPTVTPTLSITPTATPQANLTLPDDLVAQNVPGNAGIDLDFLAQIFPQANIEPSSTFERRITS